MSLIAFKNSTSSLLGRIVKVTSNNHTSLFNKGDLVKISLIYYGNKVRVTTHTSQNSIVNEDKSRRWTMSLSCLSLIDRLETDPPLPIRAPRLTAKKLAELKIKNGCISYVQQACQLLDFNYSAIDDATLNALVTSYNVPVGGKGAINKALSIFFASLPKKEKITPLNANFDCLNVALVTKTDNRQKELDKVQKEIDLYTKHNLSLTNDINLYNTYILNKTTLINNNNILLTEFNDKIETIKARPIGSLKIPHHDKIQSSLESLKRSLCTLVNHSAFYNIESFSVPENGKLHLLKIVLRTNDVWLSESENLLAPKINMGSYLVTWKPFNWLCNNDEIPYDNDSADTEYSESAYTNFLNSMSGNIKINSFKNNILIGNYIHPHVSSSDICWGNVLDQVELALVYDTNYKFNKPENAFIVLRELLKTYNAASPYIKLMEFRRKQNPSWVKTLEQVHVHKTSKYISLDYSKYTTYQGIVELAKINPSSIVKYLDSNCSTISPEKTSEHCYIEVKIYAVYYMGTDVQSKNEKDKLYIKCIDNTFITYTIVNSSNCDVMTQYVAASPALTT